MGTDVLEGVQPSADQRAVFGPLLLGDDPANGWWLAWCPRCDGDQSPLRATAEVNFQIGRFKCTNLPSCHEGKPSVSLATAQAWIRGFASINEMRDAQRTERQATIDAREADRKAKAEKRAEEKQVKQAATERLRAERRARRQDRFAGTGDKLTALANKFPAVDRKLLPTKPQLAVWEPWVKTDKPPILMSATDGWWEGWCPIHDKEHKGKASAMFNFRYGSYKCLQAEPCHLPKKGMTLVNLARAMNA